MSGLRKGFWAVPFLAALPSPATAADICDRIVAASREEVPFASLQRALAAGEFTVQEFYPGECRVIPGQRLVCSNEGHAMRPRFGWQPPDCISRSGVEIPADPTDAEERESISREGFRYAYRLSGLRFVWRAGCLLCRGPATYRFEVAADPAPDS